MLTNHLHYRHSTSYVGRFDCPVLYQAADLHHLGASHRHVPSPGLSDAGADLEAGSELDPGTPD